MKKYYSVLPLLVMCLLLSSCTNRPEAELSPSATEAPPEEYSLSFYLGDQLLTRCLYTDASSIEIPTLTDPHLKVVSWQYEDGSVADPVHPRSGDATVYALMRPVLNKSPYLASDENGCIRPADPMTYEDVLQALGILLEGIDYPVDISFLSTETSAPIPAEECNSVLSAIAEPSWEAGFTGETVLRGEFALAVDDIRGDDITPDTYFPDNHPGSPWYSALKNAGIPRNSTPEDYIEKLVDGFLWLDGFLYGWDSENSCFLISEQQDGLAFDGNGRYTSGNTELDAFVAQTLSEYCDFSKSRLENLKTLYLHVKNDFQYLPRNYYESGETGWEINEALTMFETDKGNCYCFTGAFCALARGLGFNAVTWSGTMGTENQKHAWTEITLDDEVYICDPEIELNYWLLEMYTDNFMMPKSQSGGWNYQAIGRDNSIPME